jgi:hypothetical protein
MVVSYEAKNSQKCVEKSALPDHQVTRVGNPIAVLDSAGTRFGSLGRSPACFPRKLMTMQLKSGTCDNRLRL